jgi:transposase
MARRPRTRREEEIDPIRRRAHSRMAPARAVQRARMVWLAHQGQRGPAIAQARPLTPTTVRSGLTRFTRQGLPGLEEQPRPGRPATDSPAQGSEVSATALTDPPPLSLPFACWTRERLPACRPAVKGRGSTRPRLDELWLAEGWRWRRQASWVGARVDPAFAEKRGASPRSTRRRPPRVSESAWRRGAQRAPRVFRDQSWCRSTRPRLGPTRRGGLPVQRGVGRRAPAGGPLKSALRGAGARAMSVGPSSPPPATRCRRRRRAARQPTTWIAARGGRPGCRRTWSGSPRSWIT